MSTADAPAREAAWLADYNPADGLPALLQANGGPWQVVQAYWPRTPDRMGKSVFVMRHSIKNERFANVQKISKYVFRLICWWPMVSPTGAAEQSQGDFDTALDLLVQRIVGPLMDKTHGGRFLSVAEDPSAIEITYHDPVQTLASGNFLAAEITYTADDPNYNA
ncbi:hypothetical protein ACFORO_12540 [Amycolatopsis halotolerans]|uniref:Uncharacterized protein n=1 Tax=Amycolatopsis halotolerans TaxID=330083 RepID=A0ABV7QGB6_9PSEU